MKVLEIINRKRFWGGEDVAADQIAESLSSNHSLERCIFDTKDWIKAGGPNAVQKLAWMWKNPKSLNRLVEVTRNFKPDFWLVHGVIPVASLGVYTCAAKLDIPIIHYAHNFRPFSVNSYLWTNNHIESAGLKGNFWPEILAGSWQDSRIKSFALGAMFWLALRRKQFDAVSHWIAISDFVRDRFIEAGIPPRKVSTLRHFHRFVNSSLPQPQDKGYYLFLGRLSVEKGVRFLIETWNTIFQTLGANGPKLILGGDGPLTAEVRAAQAANPLVESKGFVDGTDKQLLLRNARAVVIPSLWWEGLGLVAYEAYDHAKPVLAADSGGLSEIVIHGETGLKHLPGDVSQLRSHIIQLENNPLFGHKLGEQGRKWLEENAGEQRWLKDFERIAQSTLSNL
jgi:glycosyltransferase involved in cell wall biosynthesis